MQHPTPLEYDTRYRLGTRTFLYTYIRYGWKLTVLGISLVYIAWLIHFGVWRTGTDAWLATHHDWYIDGSMLAEWIILTGFSFLFVGLLRGWVMYRHKSFMVDRNALHLRRGLFRTRETRIPYQQISNIEIERPYHFRILGLAQLDVTISSGDRDTGRSADSREFLVPIIDAHLARALSHHILEHSTHDMEIDDAYADDEYTDESSHLTPQESQEARNYRVYTDR